MRGIWKGVRWAKAKVKKPQSKGGNSLCGRNLQLRLSFSNFWQKSKMHNHNAAKHWRWMAPLGLVEVARTGVAAMARGPEGM